MTNIDINFFSDASIKGVCTVAYAITYQPNKISQAFITSKTRLVKKNLTIPYLELITAKCLQISLKITKMLSIIKM